MFPWRFLNILALTNQRRFSSFIDIFLYEVTIVYVVGFVVFVLAGAGAVLFGQYLCSNLLQRSLVEILWSVLPLLVLRRVVVPRVWFIFVLESLGETSVRVKVSGYQ